MQEIFSTIRSLIEKEQFRLLEELDIQKPAKFNWVRDVFEKLNVHQFPKAKALVWSDGNNTETFSFEQLSKETNALVNFLRKHQLEEQDIIFFQMALLPANWLVMLAGIKGGYRLIPAATVLSVHDIVYRFGKLNTKVVFSDLANAAKIDEAEVLTGKPVPLKVIVDGTREGWHSLDEIYEEPDVAIAADTRPDDPLFLFFTSGTTGMPKVVIHTHLSYPLGHFTTAAWIGLKEGDLHYNISQPGWAKFAWSSFFAPWNMGAAIFAFNPGGRFNAKEQLEAMQQHKVTTFCSPPTVLRMLIQEDLPAYKLSIRQCVAAGEPLNPEVIEIWKKGTGLIIRDGYGQTESTLLAGNLPGSPIRYGSMGLPTFLYDIVIADDDGKEMPAEEEGNITVRTTTIKPNGLFTGYYDDLAKQQAVFKNGLYYTGDKAYRDKDGFIWFVGRDDDVIKSSDYRIGPFEVESVLLEHEAVMESAVVGSPHPVKGYEVKAFILLSAGYEPTQHLADEIFAFSRKNLSAYKMPRNIEFVTELPKTISGKIRRVELRAREAQNKLGGIKPALEFVYQQS